MTATVTYHPRLAEACDRFNELDRQAAAYERAETIRRAKRVIDDPRGYSDEQLREVCAAFMALSPTDDELADDYGLYYLRADAHIFAINKREKIARIAPETPRDVLASMHDRVPEIVIGVAIGAVVILAWAGWL